MSQSKLIASVAIPQVADIAVDISVKPLPDHDRSAISVYPPFGYAPTKTAPSIRPRAIVRELPPIPPDFARARAFGELAFWSFWFALAGEAVFGFLRDPRIALAAALMQITAYVVAVKLLRHRARTGRMLGAVEARTDPPAPLAGIRASRFDRLQFALVKVPLQNLRFIRFALTTFPWTVLRLAVRYARPGGYRCEITDEDCWNLLTSTALLVPAIFSEDGSFLDLDAPDDLTLTTAQGVSLADVKIRFDVATHQVVHCLFQGQDMKEDKELVVGILHSLLAVWAHTKSHLASEAAAREIRNHGAKLVSPCSAFTLSLHEYLVFSEKGPIQTDGQAGVKGFTVYQAASIPMAHTLDKRKVVFRYYELLFNARLAVRKLVHQHAVPVSGELLFNTCVVHSLDHLNTYEWARGRMWSLDLTKSFTSRLMSVWFTQFYTRPMVNPFYSEYLRDEGGPFFGELHKELLALDPKLANSLLLSTSY